MPTHHTRVTISEDIENIPPVIRESDDQGSEDQEIVDKEVLMLWLRRAVRKFRQGVPVIRVMHTGKLTKRQLFVNAKLNYMELISTKLFDIAYPLAEIEEVKHGLDSPDFRAFTDIEPNRQPKAERSLVIQVSGEKPISLVFMTEADRRDAQFLLRIENAAAQLEMTASEVAASVASSSGKRSEVKVAAIHGLSGAL